MYRLFAAFALVFSFFTDTLVLPAFAETLGPIRFVSADQEKDEFYLHTVALENDKLALIWIEGTSRFSPRPVRIVGRIYDQKLDTLSTPVELVPLSDYLRSFDITLSSNGDLILVWVEGGNIYTRKLNQKLNFTTDIVTLNQSSLVYYSKIVNFKNDRSLITWVSYNSGENSYSVVATVVDKKLQPVLAPTVLVKSITNGVEFDSVKVDSNKGIILYGVANTSPLQIKAGFVDVEKGKILSQNQTIMTLPYFPSEVYPVSPSGFAIGTFSSRIVQSVTVWDYAIQFFKSSGAADAAAFTVSSGDCYAVPPGDVVMKQIGNNDFAIAMNRGPCLSGITVNHIAFRRISKNELKSAVSIWATDSEVSPGSLYGNYYLSLDQIKKKYILGFFRTVPYQSGGSNGDILFRWVKP